MDPIDRHLKDAGAEWRAAQPEPPDLDRLISGLERHPRGRVGRPFALVFATALVLMSVVALAPGVGGLFRTGDPVPSTAATPAPSECLPTDCPSGTPVAPSASAATDLARATLLLEEYQAALVARRWQAAFDMLAPTSPTSRAGIAPYSAERAAFYSSVDGRYDVGTPTQDVPDWTRYAPLIEGADLTRAFLTVVEYPALRGNNAGVEEFVVAPDATGTWRIWPVR